MEEWLKMKKINSNLDLHYTKYSLQYLLSSNLDIAILFNTCKPVLSPCTEMDFKVVPLYELR